jgi:hypothetical protein
MMQSQYPVELRRMVCRGGRAVNGLRFGISDFGFWIEGCPSAAFSSKKLTLALDYPVG